MSPRYRVLARLLRSLKPYWQAVTVSALLALVVSGAGGLIAWLVKPAMDDIFLRRDLLMLKLIPLALLGVYIVKGLASYGESYLSKSIGERVVTRVRHDLYVHLQNMPLSFFTARHTGELTTRLVLDTSRLANLSSDMLVSTIRRVGTIVSLLVVMFTRDWALTLFVVALITRAKREGHLGGTKASLVLHELALFSPFLLVAAVFWVLIAIQFARARQRPTGRATRA